MTERKPHEAAAIEAWEEAGVRGGMAKKPVGRYTYLEGLDNRDVAPGMMDLFQIAVSEIRADFREHGQRQLDWVPDEAATPCPGGKLKSVLVAFKPDSRKKPPHQLQAQRRLPREAAPLSLSPCSMRWFRADGPQRWAVCER